MKCEPIQRANASERCQCCPIRDLVLFADLQCDDFDLIHFPIDEIKLNSDNVLYQENTPANNVYTIRSGLVKLLRYLPNGNTRIVRLLRQGDLAGIEALNRQHYLQTAIALDNTEICRIPVTGLEELNRQTPHLYRQLTARWQRIQQDADIWLAELTTGNARHRLARLLVYLSDNSQDHEFFLPTREDIGAMLAITTETASRIIADFKRQGYLHTRGQTARINNPELIR